MIMTSDLYFAAFLQCMGCKIVKTSKESSKFTFTFEDPCFLTGGLNGHHCKATNCLCSQTSRI